MVKECIIKLNNDVVTVVRYDDIDVQLPSIHREAKTIFVNYENGKYSVIDKDYKLKGTMINDKKNDKKNTTIDKSESNTKDVHNYEHLIDRK